MSNLKEIKITDIKNIRIGQTENTDAATGCTVFISENGMRAGLDVRGGGPASRESELMKPVASAEEIHAVVLGGGSAFGLDAAGGVMKYLEEKGIGFDVGVTKVPLVCQADIFDLTVGDTFTRPDKEMGYKAAIASENGNYKDGNYGAGCGASVGKFAGMDYCMKSGIGSYAVQIGDLQVGAVVVVNALGDIFDHTNGQKIAGLLSEDKKSFRSSIDLMYQQYERVDNKFVGNTTIGIIITNAKFCKTELCKIASMAQNGLARSIKPVHTSADGDSVYAVSVGDIEADKDMVGTLSSDVMSEAISRAVKNVEPSYGLPSYKSFHTA
ncbi:MAG: P1 family peptidase [Lachnospiraceae bacterium]|nr:P1 family peptidase [Lachnospiraceae bacterium]